MGKKLPRTRVLGRITSAGVELELYAQPTQNVWWKYRQKKSPTANHASRTAIESLRIHVPGPPMRVRFVSQIS